MNIHHREEAICFVYNLYCRLLSKCSDWALRDARKAHAQGDPFYGIVKSLLESEGAEIFVEFCRLSRKHVWCGEVAWRLGLCRVLRDLAELGSEVEQ
jgi:hypothetical protein